MKKLTTTFVLLFAALIAKASSYDQANWYVSVDVQQFKSSILPKLPIKIESEAKFSFDDNIPDSVHKITVYGHSEKENDASFVISGDFQGFSLNEYIIDTMYSITDESPIALYNTQSYNGSQINHFKITPKEHNTVKNHFEKSFYSAKINNDLMAISFDKNEIENWVDQKYNASDLYKPNLVSILVDVEKATAHLGADLKSNNTHFNSAVFQKVQQVSASVSELTDAFALTAALKAADEDTAKQLKVLADGLIAMNALSGMSEEEPLLGATVEALKIEVHKNELLISTEVPFDLIPEIELD